MTIRLGKTKVAETRHQPDRTWNESFHILCAHPKDTTITITLRTNNSILGRIHIRAASLLHRLPPLSGTHCLFNEKGKPIPKLKLRFHLCFRPVELDPQWGRGLGSHGYKGLTKGVTFQQRTNCGVILYQDAHHEHSFNPPIVVAGGQVVENYRPRKLWEDVYKAMDGAKYLIYVAGWSVNPKMVLVSYTLAYMG